MVLWPFALCLYRSLIVFIYNVDDFVRCYVVYNVHECSLLKLFVINSCYIYMTLQDGEVPEALLVNVAFFCDKGGLSAIREAFQDADPISLTFPLAHHLINIVTQVWGKK